MRRLRIILSLLPSFLLMACAPAPVAATASIPDRAIQYERLLIRYSMAELGSDRYVAVLAAQTYQESLWRNDLVSRVGAMGPSQFMPATAQWFLRDLSRGLPCRDLNDFLNYDCALGAQVRYMALLRRGLKDTANECERWAMATAKYNGGGIKADRRLAAANGYDYGRWFNHSELFNGRKRAAHNFKENRDYPRRIILDLQFRFLNAGYRGNALCESFTN